MNRKSMYRSAVAVAAAALFVGSSPVRASTADDSVEASFKNSYVNKTYLKDDSIKAEAKDGIVTLTGTVADETHKSMAEQTVASQPGVTRVINKLETKAQIATEKADAWISRKLNLALMLHANVNVSKTTVQVENGVVTLSGTASSAAQKELTTEYAKDIEGVKDVKNMMTIVAAPAQGERTQGEKIDDASITAQVETALSTHRSTSALKTKVDTRNGEVTLTGITKNDAEKSLVTKLVSDVQGVSSVKNEMTVEAVKTM